MFGITCGACHVAEIRHNGKGVRVDGGPNMFDMQKFYADMFAAVKHAEDDPAVRRRVGQRLFAASYSEYGSFAPLFRPIELIADAVNIGLNWDSIQARKDLAEVIQGAIARRDATKNCADPAVKCTSGPGRLDRFNGTWNFLLARLFEDNLVELDAPVKFPPSGGFRISNGSNGAKTPTPPWSGTLKKLSAPARLCRRFGGATGRRGCLMSLT